MFPAQKRIRIAGDISINSSNGIEEIQSIGDGVSVIGNGTGPIAQLRNIKAGTGIDVAIDGDSVEISNTETGNVTQIQNGLGVGTSLIQSGLPPIPKLRTLGTGAIPNISYNVSGEVIQISTLECTPSVSGTVPGRAPTNENFGVGKSILTTIGAGSTRNIGFGFNNVNSIGASSTNNIGIGYGNLTTILGGCSNNTALGYQNSIGGVNNINNNLLVGRDNISNNTDNYIFGRNNLAMHQNQLILGSANTTVANGQITLGGTAQTSLRIFSLSSITQPNTTDYAMYYDPATKYVTYSQTQGTVIQFFGNNNPVNPMSKSIRVNSFQHIYTSGASSETITFDPILNPSNMAYFAQITPEYKNVSDPKLFARFLRPDNYTMTLIVEEWDSGTKDWVPTTSPTYLDILVQFN